MQLHEVNFRNPLTIDCEVWAKARRDDLSMHFKARFLFIKSATGHVGPYKLPAAKGGTWWPGPDISRWPHYYAVIIPGDDWVMDELYPDGMPLTTYKKLFAWHESLQFIMQDDPSLDEGTEV